MRRSTSRWCDRKKVTSRRGVLLSVLLCPGVRAAAAAAAMPMKGRFPVRRTLQYLQSGDIVFKSSVKVMTVNYNTHGELGEGARKFVFFNIPQIQYKNPWLQIMMFKNMTPSPFLKFYLGKDGCLFRGFPEPLFQ
ncbi:hypothetical protein FKM82_004401 [Ascaphus truei]